MALEQRQDQTWFDSPLSPGGFGIQGWSWGDPKPKTITFFLDNTAKVCDQHGRPIVRSVMDGKVTLFAQTPPSPDDVATVRGKLATHVQVIAALEAERIEWAALTIAGWPQLPYEALKKLPFTPVTPLEELRKIKDSQLRKDALRFRREADEAARAEEMAASEE